MTRKDIIRLLLLLITTSLPSGFLLSQKIPDHEVFIERIRNSSDNIYSECIEEYDAYLSNHPDDVTAIIEKCRFIQLAQYNEEEDYNPNQEVFDSCAADLKERFPEHPEVLLFQITYLWGEELEGVFETAEKTVEKDSIEWTKENLAMLYSSMADHYYYEPDYKKAFHYITLAIINDEKYKTSLEYARILVELDRDEDALEALTTEADTSGDLWQLRQKADLLLDLRSYSQALDLYNNIRERDSTYIDNYELATTFEGTGRFDLARECLVADTSENWDKEGALRNLMKHDIKYQNGDLAVATYNKFRDLGYVTDPIGFYRIRLLLAHPFEPWKARDMLGILTLLIVVTILIIIPYIWVLPVYFSGLRCSAVSNKNPYESPWRLETFWFVSAGYLLASLFACIIDPEGIYTHFNSSFTTVETTQEQKGLESLIFILIMAVFGFAALFKVNHKILLSKSWSAGKSILTGFGVLLIYKVFTGLYVHLGVEKFGVSIDDLTSIQRIVLASKDDIEAIIGTFGKGAALLLIAVIAPFYEEVIFRGVILDSCQRYLNFNIANIFQAALFSTIHLSLFLFPVFFIFGLLAGYMRKKSGGLLPGIVFHMVNNTLALTLFFIS